MQTNGYNSVNQRYLIYFISISELSYSILNISSLILIVKWYANSILSVWFNNAKQ